jgi:multidrug efflux pump subunit AcrB
MGAFAYINVPKEIFPPTNLDAISIRGNYAGASPNILDNLAVSPIEDELKNLSDVELVESTIKTGMFTIKATLKDGSNIDDALSDIKDIIQKIKRDLPSDMVEPTAKKIKNTFPLVTIAISSDDKKERLLKVADELKKELGSIKDLSDISIRGDADKELVFALNSKKMEALGLKISQIVSALANLSNTFPVGFIKQRGDHIFLNTLSGYKSVKKLKNTLIKVNGKGVYLKDIAKIEFKLSDATEISHFNGVQNISVNINKSKSGNAIALVKRIKKILKKYEKKYPKYHLEVYSDSSVWIRNRLNTVMSNILFGLILVSLSIYTFINARISFVVALGIPTSFIIGLIALEMMDYSLNMLSLLGALIALGMLVDEAIVVAENIQRHIEEKVPPKEAAIIGAAEMFPAVLTATSTTIFAFLPMLIMSGEMGVFMKILPIMITILLLSSLFEAFFFLPLHSYEFLKEDKRAKKTDKMWDKLKEKYKSILSKLLKRPKLSLTLFLVFTLSATVILFKNSKFQLFPEFDTTQIYIKGSVNKNYSIEETQEIVSKVEKLLLKKLDKKDVASITSISGLKINNKFKADISPNYFHIFINLHERAPEGFYNTYINPLFSPEYDDKDMIREHSAYELANIIKNITKKFKKDKDFEEFDIVVPTAGIVKNDIEISLIGEDKKVKKAINKLQKAIEDINGTYNVANDMKEGEREIKFKINPYGESLGFSEKYLANILRPLFLKLEISNMYLNGKLIKVKTEDINKDKVSALKTLFISIPNSNKKVLLKDIANFNIKKIYSTIYKEDGSIIWTITGSLDKKLITSAELMKRLEPIFKKIREEGIEVKIKGEQKENQKVKREMTQAGLIALFLIFIALVWMFDSIFLSLLVLSIIPLSIFGVLVGHLIMGLNLTMPGLVGVVGLSGVVVNDGIIIIDFLKKATSKDEVLEFASKRLRPIMLTSITTILGLSTLIFFASGQSVILQPMAVSLGYGLLWATVLNLFFLPLFYYVFKKNMFVSTK